MGNIDKFDSIADRYDTPERIEMAKMIADVIRARVTDGANKNAIDYGCGTGLVGLQLLGDFRSILFIDASANMVGQVEGKMAKVHAPNAKARCCDFEAGLPADIHADYIFVVNTLIHIKDVETVLSRLYDALNAGGHLLIADFDKTGAVVSDDVHNGFDQGELAGILKKIGFADIKSETFHHGKRVFMNQDASMFIMDAVKAITLPAH